MAPRRSTRKPARYVINATFKLKTVPLTKSARDKWVRKFKSQGGTVTVKKV